LTIKSAVLGEERVVLVRTPVGYETNKLSYPVLYMTDGDDHINHTSSSIEFLTENGRMPDLIVVGVMNTDRTRDLTPVKSTTKNAAGELQFPTSGGADNFLKFFETELIPEIEKQYRVQPYRIFAGHSLGGLFAIHAMITKPGLFNSYIAVSPSLQWENKEELKRAEDFLKAQKEMKVTLFVSIGNEPGQLVSRSTVSKNCFLRRASRVLIGRQNVWLTKTTAQWYFAVTILDCERCMTAGWVPEIQRVVRCSAV
jgi:predicted alpha/beta superfamily hydrolase